MAGEMDHMLAGPTADLHHIPKASGEMLLQDRPDRLVVAMERRGIEPAIRLDASAVSAKFHRMFSQLRLPENEDG